MWENIQTLKSLLSSWVTAGFIWGGVIIQVGGGKRGLSQKCFTLTSLAAHESRCEEGYKTKKQSGFILVTLWIRCKRVVTAACELERLQSEAKENKQIQISQLVLVQWCHWRVKRRAGRGVEAGWRRAGWGVFNCGAGCTFHSALCRAGSWRCSGGRTTWLRRRLALRGRPWPRNPESWRAARQLYLKDRRGITGC